MAPKLTDKEREQISAYLRDGKSHNWTAKKVKRSVDTVGRIARAEGIESDKRTPKKANEARMHFAKEDRLALIGYGLNRGGQLLQLELTPQQYKDVMTGVAIGVDKHRLETGDVTDRTENVDPSRRERIKAGFDELAERRRVGR